MPRCLSYWLLLCTKEENDKRAGYSYATAFMQTIYDIMGRENEARGGRKNEDRPERPVGQHTINMLKDMINETQFREILQRVDELLDKTPEEQKRVVEEHFNKELGIAKMFVEAFST